MRKGVYLYEYLDDWEKLNESLLPEKEDFYSHMNMEGITDADYVHTKKVCKGFEIKKLGDYHDLYVQSDIFIVNWYIWELMSLRTMCLEIYELNAAKSFSVPGLALQTALKKTKIKLVLLTDIDMLLMVEISIRRGICYSIDWYAKANNKYLKNYDKNKESSYLQLWDLNNLYGWEISQKLPVNNFEWMKGTFQFNEEFIKTIMKKVMKDIL